MGDRDLFIERDNVRLRYRIEGSGPAVLFLHGWALDLDMWSPQFSVLAARYRVIAFDRRGFGRSTGVPSVAEDVSDVEHLLRTLSVQRAAIVGMSQGSRVALRCALKRPRLTSCLVLDGAAQERAVSDASSPEELPMSRYRQMARREGIEAVREAWARHPLTQLRTADPRMHALLQRIVARYPGCDLMEPAAAHPKPVEGLHSLQTPTLVVNGEHDSPQRLEYGAALARALPHAQRSIVPVAGHLSNLDNAVAYNALISDFVRAHAAPLPYATSG